MTKEELEQVKQDALKGLCIHDARSPYSGGGNREWCSCDNCYNGVTVPSETILELLDHIESLSIINQLNINSHGTRKELPPV